MASQVKQNYENECELGVNDQINTELKAMYTYLAMATYFDRHDVAFPGICKFFKKSAMEELEHAKKFMEFQNKRGGKVVFQPIPVPAAQEWASPLAAFIAAQQLEREVNQKLLDLHKKSDKHGDFQMSDFLEGEFLQEQVDAIKELGGYITQLERVTKGSDPGHGEFHFDKELGED